MKAMERRQFINRLMRWGLFASMIALVGVFVTKGKVSEQACQLNSVCDKCASKGNCELPQAKKQLKNEREK